MIWIVMLVLALVMYKLGILIVLATILAIGLKAALLVIFLMAIPLIWLLIKRNKQPQQVHTLRKDQWREL